MRAYAFLRTLEEEPADASICEAKLKAQNIFPSDSMYEWKAVASPTPDPSDPTTSDDDASPPIKVGIVYKDVPDEFIPKKDVYCDAQRLSADSGVECYDVNNEGRTQVGCEGDSNPTIERKSTLLGFNAGKVITASSLDYGNYNTFLEIMQVKQILLGMLIHL